MSEHTPGPWRIVAEGKTPPRPLTHEVATVGFLQVWGTGVDLRQTVEADARVIAAAPRMLAALKALERAIPKSDEGNLAAEWLEAQAAIADAESGEAS